MIKKVPRYLLTFFNTSGAIAVERFCKEHEIPGRLIPVPREISASCRTRNLPDWWNCNRPSRADTESGRSSPSSAGWMRGRVAAAFAAFCNSVMLPRVVQFSWTVLCWQTCLRKTKNPRICEGHWLGCLDSNQEWLNQNQLCCQLHHIPIWQAWQLRKVVRRTPDRI